MIKPIKNNVVVSVIPEKQRTESGIILLPGNQQNKLEGKVLAVGPTAESNLKVGQTIIFDKFGANPYKKGNETVLVIKDLQIMLILGEDYE